MLSGLFSRRRRPAAPPARVLALDVETSGLDRKRNHILSLGMVPLVEGAIRWGESYYALVQPPAGWNALGPAELEALAAHQILPDDVAGAAPVDQVLAEVERRCATADALLCHGAQVDVGFLTAAFLGLGRRWTPPPVLDTLRLLGRLRARERWLGDRHDGPPQELAAARAWFGLPSYPPHHALYDALGTAELYLVLADRLAAGKPRGAAPPAAEKAR